MDYAAPARVGRPGRLMRSSQPTDPTARSLRIARVVAGIVGALLIAAALLGATSDVLLAMPVVFLMTALLAGRYPGLKTLVRIAARLRGRRLRAARSSTPPRGFGSLEPRALRLLLGSRELRGPPSATLAGI